MTDLFLNEPILNIKTEEEHPNWHLYFDEAVNVHGNGIKTHFDLPNRGTLSSGRQIEIPLH